MREKMRTTKMHMRVTITASKRCELQSGLNEVKFSDWPRRCLRNTSGVNFSIIALPAERRRATWSRVGLAAMTESSLGGSELALWTRRMAGETRRWGVTWPM